MRDPKRSRSKPTHHLGRYAFILSLATVYCLLSTSLWAVDPKSPIEVLALNAQRYQDFIRNRIRCEVFGEIKNLSNRPLKTVTIILDFLDEKGEVVATEEVALSLRVIERRKPRGEIRPLRPQEIGNFYQDTLQCPKQWLEGRIRYQIKNLEWQ